MKSLARIALVASGALTMSLASPARGVPTQLPYVGHLAFEGGGAYSGTVDLGVSLYWQPTGGVAFWTHTFVGKPVLDGVLAAVLGGEGGPAIDAADLLAPEVWVELSLGEVVLTPRQRLLSVPYARLAGDAASLGGAPATDYALAAELVAVAAGALEEGAVGTTAIADGAITPDKLSDACDVGQVLQKGESGWACADAAGLGGAPGGGIPVFASPSARDASIPEPTEGQAAFLTDVGRLMFYFGGEWRDYPTTGASLQAKGTTALNPARSAREAYESGLTHGNTAWIEIAGTPYLMQYDPSDRFGTGQLGWVHYSSAFFGEHHATIPWEVFGSPSNITGAWNTSSATSLAHDTIAQGAMRIGRDQAHTNGVLSLTTIRVALPAMTAARYALTSAFAGGTDAPDFGTSWQSGQPYTQIVTNTPYQDNGSGYWTVVWSGSPAGSWSNDLLILDAGQPPGTGSNYLGSYTFTGTVQSFSAQVGSSIQVPYAIFGTTDAYREYVYLNEWGIWLH